MGPDEDGATCTLRPSPRRVLLAQGRLVPVRRSTTGALSSYTYGDPGAAPEWVRLVRVGDTFTAYRSHDGANWEELGSATVAMGRDVFIGLAVTSHNNGVLNTATFDSVTATVD